MKKAKDNYNINLDLITDIKDMDAVVIAVAHDEYLNLSQEDLNKIFKNVPNKNKVLLDIKGLLSRKEYESAGYNYWRL